MMNFRNFLIEQKDEKDMVREVHHLPLHNGHEGVAETANALEDVHNELLGKKGSIPKFIEQDGLPITFGINKKMFFIEFNDIKFSTFEDIDNNFQQTELNDLLKEALTFIPSIIPRHSKFYGGKISKNDRNVLTLSIETDSRGNPIKDKELKKFNSDKNIEIINNKIKVDPSNYTPEDQNNFLMNMNNAKKAYMKMDPDALDAVSGHTGKIKKYIKLKDEMNDKHSVEDFINELMKESHGKAIRRKDMYDSPESSDKAIKNHEKDVNHILQNDKHFKSVLDVIRSLTNSSKILANILMKNGNKGDILFHHSDGKKSKLKVPKSINEETNTTSIVSSSSGDIRGMGYVSGNPGGVSTSYKGGNVVDSDQRSSILSKLIKDFHIRHHNKDKK